MPGTIKIFRAYLTDVFVETGSHIGEGIVKALAAGFKEVRSIEAGEKQYRHCLERFRGDPRVRLWRGDSAVCLKHVISDVRRPVTFWLDGHYSEGDTCRCEHEQPLLFELAQIADHPVKNHFVLIDDWREYGRHAEEVHGFLRRIMTPSFRTTLVDDIYVAVPGDGP
jgi:hypothetical protein